MSRESIVPVFKIKVVVLGTKNSGKSKVTNSLFSIQGSFISKRIFKSTKYWKLRGPLLTQYEDSQFRKKILEENLEAEGWKLETLKHETLTFSLKNKEKEIKLTCKDSKTYDTWILRLESLLSPLPQKTNGISIKNFNVNDTTSFNSKIQFNVWDLETFPEYNPYYYFITLKSVFIIVWNLQESQDSLKGWFTFLASMLPLEKENEENSAQPYLVFVIGTHLDQLPQNVKSEEERQKEVENLAKTSQLLSPIIYHEVSCMTHEGMEEFENNLIQQVKTIPWIGKNLHMFGKTQQGLEIMEKLKGKKEEDFILSLPQVQTYIYKEKKVLFDEQLLSEVLTVLSNWGDCLYIKGIDSASSFLILDPPKLAKYISETIMNEKDEKGRCNSTNFENGSMPQLLEFIQKIDFGFLLTPQKKVIFPGLISKKPEEDSLQELPDEVKRLKERARILEFRVLNQEFISRVFVHLHERIFEQRIWQSGIVLQHENTFAVVKTNDDKSNPQKTIKILTYSNDPKNAKEMFEYIDSKIKLVCQIFPGLNGYIQFILSPYARDGKIKISECQADLKRPHNSRTLICPKTRLPLRAERLLMKEALMEEGNFYLYLFIYLLLSLLFLYCIVLH